MIQRTRLRVLSIFSAAFGFLLAFFGSQSSARSQSNADSSVPKKELRVAAGNQLPQFMPSPFTTPKKTLRQAPGAQPPPQFMPSPLTVTKVQRFDGSIVELSSFLTDEAMQKKFQTQMIEQGVTNVNEGDVTRFLLMEVLQRQGEIEKKLSMPQ